MFNRNKQPQVVIHQFSLSPDLSRQVDQFLSELGRLVVVIDKRKEQHSTFIGGRVMKRVPSNTPNIAIEISPFTSALDAEGRNIPGVSGFGYLVESSDTEGVAFQAAADSPLDGQGNPLKGELVIGGQNEDGSPREATVMVRVVDASGTVLTNLGGEVYSVEAGAFASGVGGGVTIAEPQPPPGT